MSDNCRSVAYAKCITGNYMDKSFCRSNTYVLQRAGFGRPFSYFSGHLTASNDTVQFNSHQSPPRAVTNRRAFSRTKVGRHVIHVFEIKGPSISGKYSLHVMKTQRHTLLGFIPLQIFNKFELFLKFQIILEFRRKSICPCCACAVFFYQSNFC